MDINNIALVRATNVIPFDGEVKPISETAYIRKNTNSEFAISVRNMLSKQEGWPEMDWSKYTDEYFEEVSKKQDELLKQYIPYSSDYNSMVLWALNGLVPDDMNNKFSDKTCAIIEGLSEQIDNNNVKSLVPTDTAIKGSIKLSDQAIILINKDRYEKLTQEQKEQLNSLELTIKVFEGDLKENVDKTLEETGRYTPETLTLTREDKGYRQSETSEDTLETIGNIAKERNIAQVLFYNIIMQQNDEMDKLQDVKYEFENSRKIDEFYRKEFFKYLIDNMDIDEELQWKILECGNVQVYLDELCEEIQEIGIDKYKKIVTKYNDSIEELKENGKLPTPQQIINNPDIDLIKLIEQQNEELIIHSSQEDLKEIALEATLENEQEVVRETREDVQNLRNPQIDKAENDKSEIAD